MGTIYFSVNTGGFYSSDLHSTRPNDAVEISDEDHQSILVALNEGKVVSLINGIPTISDAPVTAPTIAKLKAYAAAKRYAIETGGVTIDGVTVDTSRESQTMITGATAYVAANPDATITFKAVSGWVDLTAAQVTAIGAAVGAHVQACFTAEAAVDTAIDAGTITTTSEIDGYPWPAG